MAWRKDRGVDGGAETVEIATSGNRAIVTGPHEAVSAFIDQMLDATDRARGRSTRLVADGAQLAANVGAYGQTHREYIEFSARARELLKANGAIPTGDGHFRSFVHNGKHLAGNLDWKKVDLAPEQALGLQAAAGQLALRAAIKEITVALERIEGKVDKLTELAKAERRGAVIADRMTLQPLAERVRSTGTLSSTDWSTVASLGPLIARDIEAFRSYTVGRLKDVEQRRLVRPRAAAAKGLTDDLLRESVALLVVAEANYALWQELRLANTIDHEPAATAAVTVDIHAQLSALARADQLLVDMLQDVADQLDSPTGFEGLAPLQKRRLRQSVAQLDEISEWFCDQRHLDDRPSDRPDLAGLTQSLGNAGAAIASAARVTVKAIAAAPERTRQRTGRGDAGARLPQDAQTDLHR